MTTINPIDKQALILLDRSQRQLTPQQFRTLRGQILAGNADGALRGLQKTLERKARAHD
jgi:hypothetical protein